MVETLDRRHRVHPLPVARCPTTHPQAAVDSVSQLREAPPMDDHHDWNLDVLEAVAALPPT